MERDKTSRRNQNWILIFSLLVAVTGCREIKEPRSFEVMTVSASDGTLYLGLLDDGIAYLVFVEDSVDAAKNRPYVSVAADKNGRGTKATLFFGDGRSRTLEQLEGGLFVFERGLYRSGNIKVEKADVLQWINEMDTRTDPKDVSLFWRFIRWLINHPEKGFAISFEANELNEITK